VHGRHRGRAPIVALVGLLAAIALGAPSANAASWKRCDFSHVYQLHPHQSWARIWQLKVKGPGCRQVTKTLNRAAKAEPFANELAAFNPGDLRGVLRAIWAKGGAISMQPHFRGKAEQHVVAYSDDGSPVYRCIGRFQTVVRKHDKLIGKARYTHSFPNGERPCYGNGPAPPKPPEDQSSPPKAAFTVDYASGANVVVTDHSYGGTDEGGEELYDFSEHWDWGDGKTENKGPGSSGTGGHVYAAGGTYTIRLTIKNGDGLSSTVAHTVTLSGP
jgi:hypothetical protein